MFKTNLTALATGLTMLMALGSVAFAEDITINADVSSYLTVTANYNTVTFGALTSPSANNSAPSFATGVYNFTVDTNKNYKVSASGTNFTSGGNSIAIANLRFDSDTSAGSLAVGNSVALTTSPVLQQDNIAYSNAVNYHGYWLTVPISQPSGSYTSTVTLTIANVA